MFKIKGTDYHHHAKSKRELIAMFKLEGLDYHAERRQN